MVLVLPNRVPEPIWQGDPPISRLAVIKECGPRARRAGSPRRHLPEPPMPTTTLPPRSLDDAIVLQASMPARQAVRALKLARAADHRDARALVCIRDDGDLHGWMSPGTQVEHDELTARVDLAVARLPLMCRQVFQMVREDDASYAATSLTLGITRHTVKEHLTAAHRRLRAALVNARVFAPRVPRAGPPRVMDKVNDLPAQLLDPATDRQDSSA